MVRRWHRINLTEQSRECIRLFSVSLQPFLTVKFKQPINQLVHVARNDAIQLVNTESTAMIRHTVLRKVVGPNSLTSVTRADKSSTSFGTLGIGLSLLQFKDAALQNTKCFRSVLVLALS